MRKLTQWLITASLPALLLANISMAAETGSALKNDSIRFEPFSDAKVTGSFTRGESLEIIKNKVLGYKLKLQKVPVGYAYYPSSTAHLQALAIKLQVY